MGDADDTCQLPLQPRRRTVQPSAVRPNFRVPRRNYSYAPSTQPGADNLTGWLSTQTRRQRFGSSTWIPGNGHCRPGSIPTSSSFPALSLNGSGVIKTVPVGYRRDGSPRLARFRCHAGGLLEWVWRRVRCYAARVDPKVAAAGDTFSSRVAAALWTAAGDADYRTTRGASYSGNVTLSAVLPAGAAGWNHR